MSTLFIADIHLHEQAAAITFGFLHFLRTRAASAEALYILGDLFDIWIGDDNYNPWHQAIAAALRALSQRGIPCYFLHGNRDFLLGKRYAAICGITLLPMQQVLQLYGQRIVILHGDILCTDDIIYQNFRRWVRHYWLQQLFLSLPLWLRQQIAKKIRFNSMSTDTSKTTNTNTIVDVNLQTVMTMMDNTGAAVMIHGHTHQPAVHCLPGKRCRVVLGAWHHHGSAIEVNAAGITLVEFSL